MSIFQLPKTIRWVLACSALLLLLMTAYRLGIYLFFDYGKAPTLEWRGMLFTGFRYDLRPVAIVTLSVLLTGFFRGTHVFKTRLGKNLGLAFYFLLIVSIVAFYVADVVSLFVYKSRLQASVVSDIMKNNDKGRLFTHGAPWLAIVLSAAIVASLIFMAIRLLHKQIGKKSIMADNPLARLYWQGLLLLTCLFLIYGRIGSPPLSYKVTNSFLPAPAAAFSLTPFDSFFSGQDDSEALLAP